VDFFVFPTNCLAHESKSILTATNLQDKNFHNSYTKVINIENTKPYEIKAWLRHLSHHLAGNGSSLL